MDGGWVERDLWGGGEGREGREIAERTMTVAVRAEDEIREKSGIGILGQSSTTRAAIFSLDGEV